MTAEGSDSSAAALIIGMDSHGLAVARALAAQGVTVYALERDASLPGAASRYVSRVFTLPDFTEDHLLPALRRVRVELAAIGRLVLFAMNDRQVGIVAHHIDEIGAIYRISWSASADVVLRLQRKDSLEKASHDQGLNYPRSVVFDQAADSNNADGFRFPVILKPVQPLSSFKTHVAHSLPEVDAFVRQKTHDLPILCQEYIEGGDEALYFGELLLDRGKSLFGMTGRKVLSHPPGQGQATVAETFEDAEVLKLTEQFFAGSGLSGPAALELKRDPQGRFWVIEPTIGRTEFLVELCIAAGFNQPWMEFQLACGRPVALPAQIEPRMWCDTERDPLVYARLCIAARSWRPRRKKAVFPYVGHGDSGPVLRAWKRFVGQRLRRLVGG